MQVYATLGPQKGIALEKMIVLRFIPTPLKIKRPARVGPGNGVAKGPKGDRMTRVAPKGTKVETGIEIDPDSRDRTVTGTAIELKADLVLGHSTVVGAVIHETGITALIRRAKSEDEVQTEAAVQEEPAANHLDQSIRRVRARGHPHNTRKDPGHQISQDDLLPSKLK